MADFDSKSQTFLSWFKSQPGATFDPRITLTDLRAQHAGRGIIANADIPAETELFNIPRRSVLSIENSDISKKLPQIFSTLRLLQEGKQSGNAEESKDAENDDDEEAPELVEMPDPWLDLILVLIYEFLQGDKSLWKPYFDVLPAEFNTLMFWSEDELSELQASAVKDRIGKESADEMFATKILPVVREHAEVFYGGNERLSDEEVVKLAHRMGSVIMAYAFDLDQEDEDEDEDEEDGWTQDRDAMKQMGMVPMADMLNADAEFNVSPPLPPPPTQTRFEQS